MYNYNAKITKVIDGDTFELKINLGFDVSIKERIRLIGVYAPETSGQLGKIIKDRVKSELLHQKVILKLKYTSTGKRSKSFDRTLGILLLEKEHEKFGINLNNYLNKVIEEERIYYMRRNMEKRIYPTERSM